MNPLDSKNTFKNLNQSASVKSQLRSIIVGRILMFGLLLSLIIILFGIVGQMSYEDEVREHAHYCDMVAEGTWPDYDNLYDQCDLAYNNLKELENK
tara:strand:- start:1749 stop:2036 length:288 start_codon:yes stop_codon:yes gene_type:complete